jgi:high-affinity nickel permease
LSQLSAPRLLDRGVQSRLFLKRFGDRTDTSWKRTPLGALFGLDLDTATEIALLALAAGVATHHGLRVLDLGKIGDLVVALFLATRAVSVLYWKARRVEERWTV